MNWKIPAVGLLAAVSFTNASAQTELPSQWLDEQMLAAKLDRTTPRGGGAVAIDTTVVKADVVARAGAGAPPEQSKDMSRPATTAASRNLSAPK